MSDRQRSSSRSAAADSIAIWKISAWSGTLFNRRGRRIREVAFVPTASAEPDSYLVSFYTAFLRLGCRPSHLSFFKRTADLRTYLLNQDVIFVGGGNTKSMLAVWREWECRKFSARRGNQGSC